MMKTSELTGAALDWAVAKCEKNWAFEPDGCDSYSTDWALGGPIIERQRLCVYDYGGDQWGCDDNLSPRSIGPTPLIAAMRCYVASKLGDEIEVPEELK
jgi:hypothetical protein